jgi:hypothetical protein
VLLEVVSSPGDGYLHANVSYILRVWTGNDDEEEEVVEDGVNVDNGEIPVLASDVLVVVVSSVTIRSVSSLWR